MSDLKLSLCIPTNGVIEWVFPVLDSIYEQEIDENLYEVIVTDNGKNSVFKEKMREYTKKVSNLVYKETDAQGFTNQIKAFEYAKGEFIKFINHRMTLNAGSLQFLIDFVNKNEDQKPYIYFSNHVLNFDGQRAYHCFNDFAFDLSHFLSWSAGIGLWKEDFESVHLEKNYSDLFPHMNFIFPYTHKESFLLVNDKLLQQLPTDDTKKGRYNLFFTFGVEFMNQIKYLLNIGDINQKTFDHIHDDNGAFLANLYASYVLDQQPCSYDLANHDKYISEYYDLKSVKKLAKHVHMRYVFDRFKNKFKK